MLCLAMVYLSLCQAQEKASQPPTKRPLTVEQAVNLDAANLDPSSLTKARPIPVSNASQTNIVRREPVDAQLNGSIFSCSKSTVGFCAAGTVSGELFKGSKEAVYLAGGVSAGMPNVEPATTLSYSATQVFHTEKGDVFMSVVGVSDNARHVFTELARITGGTGRFVNATGNLFISGTLTPDGFSFQSKVTGEICIEFPATAPEEE